MADITIEREDTGLKNEETRGTTYVHTEITRIMLEVGLEQVVVSQELYGQRPQKVTATRRNYGFVWSHGMILKIQDF